MTMRTRWLAVFAALMIVAGIGDWFVAPLLERRADLEDEVRRAESTYRLVRDALPDLTANGGATAPASDGTLAERIESSIRRFGVSERVGRIAPVEGRVEVSVEAIPFERLLAWLTYCETELGLAATTLRLSRGRAPGQVTGTLSFGDGNGS